MIAPKFIERCARPYSRMAMSYDATVGLPFFLRARKAFEELTSRYGINFRTAADIGCGTGLFARYLTESFRVPVIAVDLSNDMLRIAARNCNGLNVRLLRQDIRQLRLPRPVDLITCNFDTLNHLIGEGDLEQTFRRVYWNLKPGGHFIFDSVTNCGPLGPSQRYVRRFRMRRRTVVQQVRWDPRARLLSVVVSIRSPGDMKPTVEVHRERAYSPDEISRALHGAGFSIRGVHDAATLALPGMCPPRIIVVAQKARRDNGADPNGPISLAMGGSMYLHEPNDQFSDHDLGQLPRQRTGALLTNQLQMPPFETITGFPTGGSSLNAGQIARINQTAEFIKNSWNGSSPIASVRVTGYINSDEWQRELGEQRAVAVRDALVTALGRLRSTLPSQIRWVIEDRGFSPLAKVEIYLWAGPTPPSVPPLVRIPSPAEAARRIVPLGPETPEQRIQRILRTLPPAPPPKRSFNQMFWRRVDEQLDSAMSRLNIPHSMRSHIRDGAHAAIRRGSEAVLNQIVAATDLPTQVQEAIRTTVRGLLDVPIQ